MNKDLLSGFELTPEEIKKIFSLTEKLKKKKTSDLLKGKIIALIFQKPSLRTRVSFEVGIRQLGAQPVYLSPQDIQLGKREPIKDIARGLSRYMDAIVARTFSHEYILEFSRYAGINIINGLSDLYHPCQALADVYTIYEKKGRVKNLKLAYIGDGNNVLHSLLAVAANVGLSLGVATPRGYEPQKGIWNESRKIAKKTKTQLFHTYNPEEAVKNADFVYTDVWTSMGQEKERQKRRRDFQGYQINTELLKLADKRCMVMHCMPMHRGEEITDEVAESAQSIVFDQAENRLHVQKAIMVMLLKNQISKCKK